VSGLYITTGIDDVLLSLRADADKLARESYPEKIVMKKKDFMFDSNYISDLKKIMSSLKQIFDMQDESEFTNVFIMHHHDIMRQYYETDCIATTIDYITSSNTPIFTNAELMKIVANGLDCRISWDIARIHGKVHAAEMEFIQTKDSCLDSKIQHLVTIMKQQI